MTACLKKYLFKLLEKGSALHRSIENDCPNGFFLVSITLVKVVFTAVEGVNLKAP